MRLPGPASTAFDRDQLRRELVEPYDERTGRDSSLTLPIRSFFPLPRTAVHPPARGSGIPDGCTAQERPMERDQLIGKIQERYGIAKEEADRQVEDWQERQPSRPRKERA